VVFSSLEVFLFCSSFKLYFLGLAVQDHALRWRWSLLKLANLAKLNSGERARLVENWWFCLTLGAENWEFCHTLFALWSIDFFYFFIILFSSPSVDYLSKRNILSCLLAIFVFFSQVKDINKQQKPQNTVQNKNKWIILIFISHQNIFSNQK
jgi:hypothetical protein